MKPAEAMRRFLEAFSANGAESLEQRLAAAEAKHARFVEQVGDVLESAHWALSTSAEDWGATFDKAWLYGLFVGWDCEEDHEHDQICGGTGPLAAVARRGSWPPAAVTKLRSLRSIVRAIEDMEAR